MTVVRLDTAGDPWVGTFPGLGRVLVHADGRIDVELTDGPDGPDGPEQRDASLRHGWGAALSSVRLGRSVVFGAGLVDPDGWCLVVVGHPDATSTVVSRLVTLGWSVLAERVQPVSWSGRPGGEHLVAHPGTAPVIVGRRTAEAHGFVGTPVRADSDALVVPVRRHAAARPVTAFVHVRAHASRRPRFVVLAGHDRVDRCTNLLAGSTIANGGTAAPIDPPAHLAETLRLARLPHAEVTIRAAELDDDLDDDIDDDPLDDLLAWWRELPPPADPT